MHKASIATASGANFVLMGTKKSMTESKAPTISVCAVRTGAGKSQTTRRLTHYIILSTTTKEAKKYEVLADYADDDLRD